jgi:hypothetical protein
MAEAAKKAPYTYNLPTENQILFGWNVKPVAKLVALVIRSFAAEQMDNTQDYDHARVTVAVNKLSEITNAKETAVNTALDELEEKGFLETDRQDEKRRSEKAKKRKPYVFRLHVGTDENYKK